MSNVPDVFNRVQSYGVQFNATATTPGYLGFVAYPLDATGKAAPGSLPIKMPCVPPDSNLVFLDDFTRYMWTGQRH